MTGAASQLFKRPARNRRTAFRALAAGIALGLAAPAALTQPSTSVVAEQDGISATLAVDGQQAVVRWHFLRPLAEPLVEVTAAVNGRPLGKPTVSQYPDGGERAGVLLMLDYSGSDRDETITQDKALMLEVAGRAKTHHQIAFALYSETPRLILPEERTATSVVRSVEGTQSRPGPAKLGLALDFATSLLALSGVDRGAVIVFTDGHSDDAIKIDDLASRAKAARLRYIFVLTPSKREADLAGLRKLTGATGGEVIERDRRKAFSEQPFGLLDSGGAARFPIGGARRYLWEDASEIKVTFRYGDRRLELAADAALPAAGVADTAAYAWQRYPAVFGAAAIALLGGIGWAGWRRRRATRNSLPAASTQTAAAPPIALATLEDVEAGTLYPVNTPLVRIGRNKDNDIVLNEPSVGRFHAVLQQVGDHSFSIVDQSSANGIFVNNKKVESATLAEGDLIALGAKVLRFRKTGAGRRAHAH